MRKTLAFLEKGNETRTQLEGDYPVFARQWQTPVSDFLALPERTKECPQMTATFYMGIVGPAFLAPDPKLEFLTRCALLCMLLQTLLADDQPRLETHWDMVATIALTVSEKIK